MNTDPIADFLTRLRNASSAKLRKVNVKHSNIRKSIAEILKQKGFIENFEEETNKAGKTVGLNITLKNNGKPLHLKRISKPSQRIYVGYKELKRVRNSLGIGLISTSSGILTDSEAREKKVGGEYLCEIY